MGHILPTPSLEKPRKHTYKWPSNGVLDATRPVQRRVHLPQLLQANTVRLRLAFLPQVESPEQLLCKTSMATFGKYRTPRMQLHTTGK